MDGEPLGAKYGGAEEDICYTGADMTGTLTLQVPDHRTLSAGADARRDLPPNIYLCSDNPASAPLEAVASEALLEGMIGIWAEAAILGTWRQPIRDYAEMYRTMLSDEEIEGSLLASALMESLERGDPAVSRQALLDLSEIPSSTFSREVRDDLVPHAEAIAGAIADPLTRDAAIRLLRRLGTEAADALPAIIEALDDDNPEVRYEATGALVSISPDAKIVPHLVDALHDPAPDVRRMGAMGLVELGGDAVDAVPALIDALGDDDQDVSRLSFEALAAIGPGAVDAVPALIDALGDSDWHVCERSLEALKAIGADAMDAVPAIISLMDTATFGNSIVRHTVFETLEAITGEDLDDDVNAWQEWARTGAPVPAATFAPSPESNN
ncbi:MAG: HEAT repeat domain-containing protein [Anaerolineae bacterium]|nr:HEAT repeat domain-containing protein [Anaerolineae bacterium]